MHYLLYGVGFVVAFIVAVVLTYGIRNTAISRGWVKGPASNRHIHSKPVPRLGGVAIYCGFVAVAGVLLTFSVITGSADASDIRKLTGVLLPATAIFLVGLYDDFRNLAPRWKFAAQAACGLALFGSGFRFLIPPAVMSPELGVVAAPLFTIGWTVLICNAFNLIDGVDGLAAGSALASTLTMFGVSLYTHNHTVALLAVVLAGAIAGFLRYNFSPATIFLGDCGSLLLGFLLAAFSLTGATQQKSTTVFAAAIPVVAFGFPIVETLVSILRRFISGQPVFRADRQHIHHRLMELGISPVGVATLVYGISAVCGLLSLALLSPGAAPIAVVLTVFGILVVVGLQRLYYNEVIEFGRFARYSLRQRRTIPNNLVVRRASEHISTAPDFPAVCALLEDAFGACEFDAFSLELFSRRNRRLVHRWVRDGVSAEPLDIMGFKLLRRDRSLCGELTLSRSDASPLMLDLNLITAELRPALELSVDRLFDEIPEKGRVIPFLRLEAQG